MSEVQGRAARVLVIGGAGFVGQHVLDCLLARNYLVAALDLTKPERGNTDVDWIIGSATDEALLASATSGCDIVIFLAASSLPNSANADMAAEIVSHVRMVVKAAEIACSQGVGMFLFASSGGTVYGSASNEALHEDCSTRPLTAYGVSKVAVENYLSVLSHLRGMRTISLRISNPFGPGQRAHRSQGFIAAAMSAAVTGEPLSIWGDGSVVRDFIYVGDVAQAFARCCAYCGSSRTINIGSGQGRALSEVIKAVEAVTNRKINVEYKNSRSFDAKSNVLDIRLARSALDWQPSTSFVDGIVITAHAWGITHTLENF